MGCCKSLLNIINNSRFHPKNLIRASSPLTPAEMTQLETLLSEIPEHCREAIIKLPVRELLNLYQYHTAASHHGLQKQWQIAIVYEQHAIKGFQALLPTNRDHYIFFNFYSILSALYLGLGEVQAAIEGIYISLAILLIHTPMDYPTISNHYYYLAEAYQCKQNWKSTAQYLAKAIETARLNNDLDQEYIRTLETKLRIAKERIASDILSNLAFCIPERKPGESTQDFHRRLNAKQVAFKVKHGTLSFDKAEFERLPDKQTELQVTDEILKDVAKHLEKHINFSFICESEKAQFIAAQFKNIQMKTSLLSAAVIEAALTIIIDRLNDKNSSNDKLYTALKKTPMLFSYTHDSMFYVKGVRVFQMERKKD